VVKLSGDGGEDEVVMSALVALAFAMGLNDGVYRWPRSSSGSFMNDRRPGDIMNARSRKC